MFWTNLRPSVDPYRALRQIHEDVNRVSDDAALNSAAEFPAVNVWSGPDSYILTAEIPGVAADKLEVTLLADTVTIRGSREPRALQEGDGYHRAERGHGKFVRSIKLPKLVNPDKVEARYAKGVLNLKLPRADAEMPRKITLKSS